MTEQELTDKVVASFGSAKDDRFREVMQALVRHAHAFVRETGLTEAEWSAAIAFLTAAGHITTDTRQEFVLLSDVLGISMLTVAVNEPGVDESTESTVLGPFFVQDSPLIELGGDIAGSATGEPHVGRRPGHGHRRQPRPRGPCRGVGGRRRRQVRRPVRRRRTRGARTPVHRRRGPLPVLGAHPHAVPDPGRRAGRPASSTTPAARRCAHRICTSW